MMVQFARSVLHGVFLLLVSAVATAAAVTGTRDASAPEQARSPGGAAETPRSSIVFPDVCYRTAEKRGKSAGCLATGDLTIGTQTISFESEKVRLSIPTASIRDVSSTQLPKDPKNDWILIKYEEGGSPSNAAFMGAAAGGDTKSIHAAAQLSWLTGAPTQPTASTEAEAASAINNLHTTRLESLYYSNSTVPKNVWRLAFTPGIDDALLRAYKAGDPDDLFRFNIIMILNRRAVTADSDEHRQQVYDCMLEAVRKDSFAWVKIEARDALRRLGAGKEVLQEADALIKDAAATGR
jgi:hypothetical protein